MDNIEKKVKIKEILEYEQRMLAHSYYLIKMSPPFSLDIKVALESFLIHARNIYYFLCENNKRRFPTDLNFIDCDLEKIKISMPAGNSINDINKFLAHITEERFDKPPDWEIDKIFTLIDEKLKSFLNELK